MQTSDYAIMYQTASGPSIYHVLWDNSQDPEEAFNAVVANIASDHKDKISELKADKKFPTITAGMSDSEVDAEYLKLIDVDLNRFNNLSLTTLDEFLKIQRDYFMAKPVVIVSREEYWDNLEVLPPLNWHTHGGMEVFFMSEFYTGNYTTMYAKVIVGDYAIHACKTVDYRDRSTWFTREDVIEVSGVAR